MRFAPALACEAEDVDDLGNLFFQASFFRKEVSQFIFPTLPPERGEHVGKGRFFFVPVPRATGEPRGDHLQHFHGQLGPSAMPTRPLPRRAFSLQTASNPVHCEGPTWTAGSAARFAFSGDGGHYGERRMLELRLTRAPLDDATRSAVIGQFSRLVGRPVLDDDFRRWTERSPAGPALHALLTSAEGRVVGHCCLFPFPLYRDGQRLIGAKAEYFFVHEEFRRDQFRDLPESNQLPALRLLRELYRHGSEQLGWDPILISAAPEVAALHRFAGAFAVNFDLFECLLTLRPCRASRLTPNLSSVQRAAILLIGTCQSLAWGLLQGLFWHRGRDLRPLSDLETIRPRSDTCGMTFSLDAEFLSWRYPKSGFDLYELGSEAGTFLAATNSPRDYLRVVDSNLDLEHVSICSLIAGLIRQARRGRNLGVRWAVYDHPKLPQRLVSRLRSLGVFCARRKRQICVYTKDRDLASTARWQFSDMLVTFDKR